MSRVRVVALGALIAMSATPESWAMNQSIEGAALGFVAFNQNKEVCAFGPATAQAYEIVEAHWVQRNRVYWEWAKDKAEANLPAVGNVTNVLGAKDPCSGISTTVWLGLATMLGVVMSVPELGPELAQLERGELKSKNAASTGDEGDPHDPEEAFNREQLRQKQSGSSSAAQASESTANLSRIEKIDRQLNKLLADKRTDGDRPFPIIYAWLVGAGADPVERDAGTCASPFYPRTCVAYPNLTWCSGDFCSFTFVVPDPDDDDGKVRLSVETTNASPNAMQFLRHTISPN